MPDNLMQTGSDWLIGIFQDHASEDVVYRRGGDSVTVKATMGETTSESVNEFGIQIKVRMNDFLIPVDDLILSSVNVRPRMGDTIERTVNGRTVTYEVLKEADEREHRESDRFGELFRIHTKEISAV